jgi:hypothetical protein
MKKQFFRFLLVCGLLLAFGTVSFAQKSGQKRKQIRRGVIFSDDFKTPENTLRKNPAKKIEKWRKRCRYHYFKRKGKTYRVYRCGNLKN